MIQNNCACPAHAHSEPERFSYALFEEVSSQKAHEFKKRRNVVEPRARAILNEGNVGPITKPIEHAPPLISDEVSRQIANARDRHDKATNLPWLHQNLVWPKRALSDRRPHFLRHRCHQETAASLSTRSLY